MFRKDLLEMLRIAPRSVADIAAQLELEPRDVEDDLLHLLKSVRHTGYRVTITPARCRHCGFSFRDDKPHKPGKCPRCWVRRSIHEHTKRVFMPPNGCNEYCCTLGRKWISPPLIQVEGPKSP